MIDLEYGTARIHAVTATQQLMTSRRFFASGLFQPIIGDVMNVDKSTVLQAITRVSKAIPEQCCRRNVQNLSEINIQNFPCVEGMVEYRDQMSRTSICQHKRFLFNLCKDLRRRRTASQTDDLDSIYVKVNLYISKCGKKIIAAVHAR